MDYTHTQLPGDLYIPLPFNIINLAAILALVVYVHVETFYDGI